MTKLVLKKVWKYRNRNYKMIRLRSGLFLLNGYYFDLGFVFRDVDSPNPAKRSMARRIAEYSVTHK